MKFITKDNKEEKEEIIELWLTKDFYGVTLMGRDNTGNTRNIMYFEDGIFYRFRDSQLEGLEVDEEGKIKEDN